MMLVWWFRFVGNIINQSIIEIDKNIIINHRCYYIIEPFHLNAPEFAYLRHIWKYVSSLQLSVYYARRNKFMVIFGIAHSYSINCIWYTNEPKNDGLRGNEYYFIVNITCTNKKESIYNW